VHRVPITEALLRHLDRAQLEAVLLRLVEREPQLADVVEREVTLLVAAPKPAERAARRTPVDVASYRRQVRSVTHGFDRRSSFDEYGIMTGVVAEPSRVLEQAAAFVRQGDGQSGLTILEVITEEFEAAYESLDDSDGEGGDFFNALGAMWTEALLSPDVTPSDRHTWAAKLESWQEWLDDYGMDDSFTAALLAAEQGWEDQQVQRLLRGEAAGDGSVEEDVEDDEHDEDDEDDISDSATQVLANARLNILERQGRRQEFLNLAAATGQARRYAAMLVQLGRVDDAVAHALEHLTTVEEARALAEDLREQGQLEAALRVGEHGLTLEGSKTQLAPWVRDLADGMGARERALAAAQVAVRADASLANFLRTGELAGDEWPQLREELLTWLRRTHTYYPQGQVDIFLHEGLLEDAMAAVEGGATHTLVEQVVDAVLSKHPDWAIRMSRQQAEPIMDGGKAQYYDAAAAWLGKARDAYRQEMLSRHQRKYKLRPLIEALG